MLTILTERVLRISARGYRRDSGSKTIFEEDVVGAVVAEVEGRYTRRQSNTLYLQRSKRDGSIAIDIAPRALSGFGGDYRLYPCPASTGSLNVLASRLALR